MSRISDLVTAEVGLLAPWGSSKSPLTATKTLALADLGFVQVSASAGAVTITLPAANVPAEVMVLRTDSSANRLVVQAAGTDKVKFHTHLNGAGYQFFVLMGVGDFWHLRSDGVGGWWPISRLNTEALGRVTYDSSLKVPPGGFAETDGLVLNRADWPWLWDHAQQSSMVIAEGVRAGNEACWTTGNTTTTFRKPEVRGDFIRPFDGGRGADAGRGIGSRQLQQVQYHGHQLPTSGSETGWGIPDATFTAGKNYNVAASAIDVARTSVDDPVSAGGIGGIGTETRPTNVALPARLKMI